MVTFTEDAVFETPLLAAIFTTRFIAGFGIVYLAASKGNRNHFPDAGYEQVRAIKQGVSWYGVPEQ